jgi:hypothetical protein
VDTGSPIKDMRKIEVGDGGPNPSFIGGATARFAL